jgi:hypothetical protein
MAKCRSVSPPGPKSIRQELATPVGQQCLHGAPRRVHKNGTLEQTARAKIELPALSERDEKWLLLITTALLLPMPGLATDRDTAPSTVGQAPAISQAQISPGPAAPLTARDAPDFVDKAETDLAEITERTWTARNFITDDTDWLKAKVDAEFTQLQVAQAKRAALFDANLKSFPGQC